MPVAAIERELHDACARLAESAAVARRCHDRYLDGPGGLPGMAGRGRVGPDLVGPDLVGRTLAGRDLVGKGGRADRRIEAAQRPRMRGGQRGHRTHQFTAGQAAASYARQASGAVQVALMAPARHGGRLGQPGAGVVEFALDRRDRHCHLCGQLAHPYGQPVAGDRQPPVISGDPSRALAARPGPGNDIRDQPGRRPGASPRSAGVPEQPESAAYRD